MKLFEKKNEKCMKSCCCCKLFWIFSTSELIQNVIWHSQSASFKLARLYDVSLQLFVHYYRYGDGISALERGPRQPLKLVELFGESLDDETPVSGVGQQHYTQSAPRLDRVQLLTQVSFQWAEWSKWRWPKVPAAAKVAWHSKYLKPSSRQCHHHHWASRFARHHSHTTPATNELYTIFQLRSPPPSPSPPSPPAQEKAIKK